jgi:ERCC4-type nuclease
MESTETFLQQAEPLRTRVILADTAEQASGIPAHLKTRGIPVQIAPLPAGDYLIGGHTLIERKTAEDFRQSVFQGRLFDQLNRILLSKFETITQVVTASEDELQSIEGIGPDRARKIYDVFRETRPPYGKKARLGLRVNGYQGQGYTPSLRQNKSSPFVAQAKEVIRA